MISGIIDSVMSAFKGDVGIGGFTTYAAVRRETSYTASAPTTYLEDGSFANDHVILNPIVISIDGAVSDIVLKENILDSIVNSLNDSLGLTPILSSSIGNTIFQKTKITQLINSARSQVRKVQNLIDFGSNVLDFFGNDSLNKSIQQKFHDDMKALVDSRQPISIDMPHGTLDNMIITSFVITSDNQDKMYSFSITVQQIRFAQTIDVQIEAAPNPAAGVKNQTSKAVDKGVQRGEEVSDSELQSLGSVVLGGIRGFFS